MTRDDITRMAREAGLFVPHAGIPENGALTRFAALVAERDNALLRQALEALVLMRDKYEEYACPACDHADAAIYALRAALEQPEQDAVVGTKTWYEDGKIVQQNIYASEFYKPLRTGPEQEPVEPLKGWKLNHARKHPDEEGVAEIGYLDPEDDRFAPILTVDTGLYYQDGQALPLAVAILSMLSAHPPRREWRGLTEEEIERITSNSMLDFARAIEAALKERNA